MNEIMLEIAALLLSLFCLIYSVTARRELYRPARGGTFTAFTSQHFAFLAMTVTVALSAATSVGATLCQRYAVGQLALELVNMGYFFFHNMLAFFFVLYIMNLCGPIHRQRAGFFALFALPLVLSEVLALSNPATRLCFYIDDALVYHRGSELWALYAIAFAYAATGLLYLFRFGRELPATDRAAALILYAVTLAGVVIQAVWAVPVELFFEAIALFGFMSMLERDEDASDSGMSHRFRGSAIIAITLTFLVVITLNVSVILNLTGAQSDQIGNIQLDIIRSDLQDTISNAESKLLRVAIEAEQLLDSEASREEIAAYFNAQYDAFQADPSFMNVYIGGSDWHCIPHFDAPSDFHAAERVWYLGAKDHPNEVYITEPYKDASTDSMCFTVSTMLSDRVTVVGMDLNFSKAQESIYRMTNDTSQTALIVTSGGLIAGYTDMSLVGERANEKLPEYSDVLRRVTSSREHASFVVKVNGQSRIIFSSETSDSWYLILSVDTETFYGESFRQMMMMGSVNLLMLVVVLIFYMIGKRNRLHTAEALSDNERVMGALGGRLRQSASQILRLSDWQMISESPNPAGIVEEIWESGRQLSALADNMRSYSSLLREQAQKEQRQREKQDIGISSAPSRSARNGIIITLVIAMVFSLALCVHATTNWGNTHMNRDADRYERQLQEWLTQQESLLYMFTDMIASQPELLNDYDEAVRLLNDIAQKYPQISACYLANPYLEPPVIMNNGWIPGADERPETRPWYRETERATNGFNVSAPYLDAQTGNYCITLSRVVYGNNNEFLGIFGIDFFLDKLINVLGESYTDTSYAFLVDSDRTIINHPNEKYQMTPEAGVSVEDTEYAEAFNRGEITVLRDYKGQLITCLSRETASGFTVMVANRWWSIYGNVVLVTLGFFLLFGSCVVVIVLLINRMIRWQGDVNRQLVEAAEAAVSAGKAKSQFLAQMSHEIRTPMNAIIGLDSIALRDKDVLPRTREQLEKIDASARHLLSLINDILDMSRIESGRMVLKEDRFHFPDFLNQISIIIDGQCADKGLHFECNRIEPMDEYFMGDDLKLKQVLINILGNSVKFTDAPGRVTFTVEQIACEKGICTLRFTMKDTGIGMDKAFIPKLFEAFSQEDATTTNRYGGSGLGMAITKNIIDMMRGRIDVESEKGVGTTFTVTVPLKQTAQEDLSGAGDQPAQDISLAGLHVLIAEDIELNAEVLTDLLELEDITSEWAENGKLAVERFAESEKGHFDAILMDMRMPVMDGLTATREIRSLDHPDAKTIPIIALTANAFEEDSQQCLQAGMNEHLAKPVDIELLKQTLNRLLPKK